MTAPIFKGEKLKLHRIEDPLGRIGDPMDLKAAPLYLASPASDYATGQTFFVDGGRQLDKAHRKQLTVAFPSVAIST